ncbi:hypothetical protein [Actinoplanes nipponensis]|uniref:hypothetical protein n=1 Tax=Actinoplanes nipponensis TaxID=135950 RepID=UPI001940DD2C|nr:hypothetical protein [Actinoplanes nipponensis]
MGTIQDPDPDRDWLKRSYTDTSTNPYSPDARTEMVGRLAEGTGGGRAARVVLRVVVGVIVGSFGVSFVVQALRYW